MRGHRKTEFFDLEFFTDIINGTGAFIYDDEDRITKSGGLLSHDIPLEVLFCQETIRQPSAAVQVRWSETLPKQYGFLPRRSRQDLEVEWDREFAVSVVVMVKI